MTLIPGDGIGPELAKRVQELFPTHLWGILLRVESWSAGPQLSEKCHPIRMEDVVSGDSQSCDVSVDLRLSCISDGGAIQ